jgi:putative MATE family efflux protein
VRVVNKNLTRPTFDDARPVWQTMALFLIPLMLSNVLQALSATTNSIFLGRLVGVHALAAVSNIFPIVFFLISFLIGVGSGSTVLIGQAYGAGEGAKVKQIAGTTLFLTIVVGIVVGILGSVFAKDLLFAIGTPADIIDESASYARITFATLPIVFVYLIYTTFLRGTGDVRTPFYALIASTALTIALSPAFIVGFAGLPKLATNGAAVANVLATILTFAGLLLYLRARKDPLALDAEMLADLRPRWDLVKKVVRLGVPTGINLVMVSLSEIAVLAFVNRFGSTATAAYGAVNQIVSYVQFPAISLGITASIFGSQAIGGGRGERFPRIVRAAVTLNYVIEGVLIAIGYLFSYAAISLFVTDPETVAVAQSLLHITLWSYAIFGNARILANIMLSSGTVLWPTILSIASIWFVEVPVAYVLMGRIGLPGVWYGYPAAFIAGLAMQTAYYFLVWKKRPLARMV